MPGNGINGVYMSDNIISFKQVTKVYRNGQKALDRVNLEIEKGEFAFLLGDSGAGKTTLLDLMRTWPLPRWSVKRLPAR